MFVKATFVTLALLSGAAYAGPTLAHYSGKATLSGTGVGACGFDITAEGKTVGLSHIIFDKYSCKKMITVTADGKKVQAKVADNCSGCAESDILLSKGAFSKLADPSVGSIHNVTWYFA